MLADESVKLFGDLPSVSICSASKPFDSFIHAIRPGAISALIITTEGIEVARGGTHVFQF